MSKVMKTLVLLAVLLPGAMNAQRGFKFGLKAGLNLTTMPTTDRSWLEINEGFVRTPKYKAGAHVGPTISLGFGRHGNASLVTDLLFSMKGGTYVYEDYYTLGNDTVAKKYDHKETVTRLCIDWPILFRYRLNMGVYGEAGIYTSIAAATKFSTDDSRYDTDELYNYVDIEESQYIPLDVGFTFGAGWISKGGFGLGLRGFMGMMDQYNTYTLFVNSLTKPSGRTINMGLQFGATYYFGWESKRRR